MSRSLLGKILMLLSATMILVLIVIGATSEVSQDGQGSAASLSPNTSTRNPQHAEFPRCQALGEAATKDAACLALWAETRRRFLTPALPPGEGG
jgi:conjugative transfer region protein TrbK